MAPPDRVDMAEILSYLVHEIRNPAFGISSTLDAWQATFTASEDQEEYLTAMRSGLDRISLTLDAVTVLTRSLRLDVATRSPAAMLSDVANRARIEARLRGVDLVERLAPGLAPVDADFGLVSRGLLLVAGAAIDRTMKDCAVELGAETTEGGGLIVKVKDARTPRPGEEASALFAFKSGPGGRASVGLAAARKIFEAHGGTAVAAFEPGGTVFTATLAPRVTGSPAPARLQGGE